MSDLFQKMLQPDKPGHLRGFTIGSSIEEVRKVEKGELIEQDFPLPNLQYYYPLQEGFDTEFGPVYNYDEQGQVTEIDFYLEYDNNRYHNIPMKQFNSLIDEFTAHFTDKFGAPREETQTVDREKHLYRYWLDKAAEPPVEVVQVLYRDPYSDKEKVMKLVFQAAEA